MALFSTSSGSSAMVKLAWVVSLAVIATFATPAFAYIGPGAGVSLVGSLLNTLIVVFLAIVAILFWPLRWLWRKIRGHGKQAPALESTQAKDA